MHPPVERLRFLDGACSVVVDTYVRRCCVPVRGSAANVRRTASSSLADLSDLLVQAVHFLKQQPHAVRQHGARQEHEGNVEVALGPPTPASEKRTPREAKPGVVRVRPHKKGRFGGTQEFTMKHLNRYPRLPSKTEQHSPPNPRPLCTGPQWFSVCDYLVFVIFRSNVHFGVFPPPFMQGGKRNGLASLR